MAIYHQDIADIELNSGSIFRNFLKHSIGLGDAAANRFGVRVFRDGDAETLSGVSCQGFFRNANGENIALTSYGTVSGNEAYVTLPQACYTVEGHFTLAIKLVGGGVTGTMRIIDGVVDNTNTGSAVAPTGSVPTYQEILSVYDQMVAAKAGSVRFDTDQTLTAAQMTQARGNIEAASENDVSDLKSAIAPIAFGDPDWNDGYYLFVNSSNVVSEQANGNYSCSDYIFIPAGATALIHTYFSGYARVVLYHSDKTYKDNYNNTSGSTSVAKDITISKAAENQYVRISCYSPQKGSAFVLVYEPLSDIVEDITEANNLISKRVKIYGSRIANKTQLSSLADAAPNTIYTFAPDSGEQATDKPADSGTMLTLNCTNDNNGGHAQIFIATDGKIYTRIKWSRSGGVAFSEWKRIVNEDEALRFLKMYGSRVSKATQLGSLDDAAPNTVYTFVSDQDPMPANKPEETGTLITLNCTNDNNGGHAQIFIGGTNNIYFRIKWSHSGSVSFFNWVKLAKSSDITTLQNKIESIVSESYADATMFLRIGVIGDSFASGVIYPSDYVSGSEANYTHYEQSWPQCLGRLCGNTVINYSVGGCTTKSWLTNYTYGKHKMETDDPCNLYILCLGINDSGLNSQQKPRVPIGSESDIGTEEDSFWRWYGDIVAAIKAHAPNALIVFSTFRRKNYSDAETTRVNSYNDAIQDIAEHYRVPCLVLTDDSFFNSEYYLEGMQNRHPTAPQYSGYARAINRLIAGSIKNNYSYYSDYNSEPI